jgi:hypothetical protein
MINLNTISFLALVGMANKHATCIPWMDEISVDKYEETVVKSPNKIWRKIEVWVNVLLMLSIPDTTGKQVDSTWKSI